MDFSEAGTPWRSIPDWVSYLLEFGYAWLSHPHDSRMIAIVSMPSDSAAAGLIALGVMRRCLERCDASDKNLHYKKLLDLARTQPSGVRLRYNHQKPLFVFDGIDKDGNPWVKKMNSRLFRRAIMRPSAMDWSIVGEAPVVLGNLQRVPYKQFYHDLVKQGEEILDLNLSESYSQVCLAGRGTGELATKAIIAEIKFRKDGVEADLSQLLTVQNWMPRTISRMLFYNSRTEKFDRKVGKPQIVIADGDTSFQKVIDGRDFQDSDVIGVVHRTMERDRLESIGNRMAGLREWYDQAQIKKLPQPIPGIGIFVMKRNRV